MIADIVEVIGPTAAARLLEHFGGREIRIPGRERGRTWDALVQAVGVEDARRLCNYFRHEVVYFASSARMHTEHNRRRAAELRAQGLPWHEIAKRLTRPQGYTARGARKLLEKMPSRCPVVADLFEQQEH